MELIRSTLDLFTDSYQLEESKETDSVIELKYTSSLLNKPQATQLIVGLSKFPKRDRVIIDIQLVDMEPITISSKGIDNVSTFLEELETLSKIKSETDTFRISLKIIKQRITNKITIYNLKLFFSFLSNLTLAGKLSVFNRLTTNNSATYFEVFELKYKFGSDTIIFSPILKTANVLTTPEEFNRKELFEKRDDNCHFDNASKYRFTPYDFHLKIRSNDSNINNLFDKLTLIFCSVFLLNFSKIVDPDEVEFKLSGFKAISFKTKFQEINSSFSSFAFKIFLWVYSEKNISDKIGLLRNILSLNWSRNNPLQYDRSLLGSLSSGYEIYLKENVKEYILIKNKISDVLLDLSQKANGIANEFIKPFKSSLAAVLTFFTTAIFAQIVKGNKPNQMFTIEMTYIAIAILIVVFIVWFIAKSDVKAAKERFSEDYKNLKRRYIDILSDDDLQIIFQNDEIHESQISYINDRVKKYNRAWVASLITIALLVLILSYFRPQIEFHQIPKSTTNISTPDTTSVLDTSTNKDSISQ